MLTTKHHEGFCLFDSQYTDYKATNTPAGRDLVREYVEAFRAEGLRVGFYYSLIDWHHPEFPIDMLHPRRDDPDAFEQSKGRDLSLIHILTQVLSVLSIMILLFSNWKELFFQPNKRRPAEAGG